MKTTVNHIIITVGPSISDPADVVKIILIHEDGKKQTFLAAIGWRLTWRRFLVWAIRRHVR